MKPTLACRLLGHNRSIPTDADLAHGARQGWLAAQDMPIRCVRCFAAIPDDPITACRRTLAAAKAP